MSQSNGTARAKPVRISRSQHFQLCEILRTQQERIQSARSLGEVHELLTGVLPFPVSKFSIEDAMKFLNIQIARKRQKPADKEERRVRMSVLSTAVMHLYEQLGVVPSESFKRLHAILNV